MACDRGVISENLREEIKTQFRRDFAYPPQYDQILLETRDYLSDEVKIKNIKTIMKLGYHAAENKKMHEILDDLKERFNTD